MPISYLPLDDRPVNASFPSLLADVGGVQLKTAGNLKDFEAHRKKSEASILSVDRWVYGGLVESRSNELSLASCLNRIKQLRRLLKTHAQETYGLTVLMRQAPSAFSEKERQIAEWVREAAIHHQSKSKQTQFLDLIPKGVWQSYLRTRNRNLTVNKEILHFAQEDLFDVLAVAVDDFSKIGVSQRERSELQRASRGSKQIAILPGTDEMGSLLLAKMLLEWFRLSPKVFPLYSHSNPDQFQLRYEGVSLSKLVREQIRLVGGSVCQDPRIADLFLFVHTPQENQMDVPMTSSARYSFRWLRTLQSFLMRGKRCILADVRFANGADSTLLRAIASLAPLDAFFGFSAWNTAANALGLALAQGVIRWGAESHGFVDLQAHQKLLALRFLEDWLYQAEIRPMMLARLRKKGRSTLFLARSFEKAAVNEVSTGLRKLGHTYLSKHFPSLEVQRVDFPWNRLFEVKIDFLLA